MSKRLLFDRDPLDQVARDRMRQETADYLGEFRYRLPMRRRTPGGPKSWDTRWPISVERAVREFGFEVVRVNAGLLARNPAHIEAIKQRAEAIWNDFLNAPSAKTKR